MKRLPLVLAGLVFAGAMPAQAAAPLSRVQVVALEFHYRLSRVRVPPGPVRIELANFGEDEHDLQLQRVGSATVHKLPMALPGQRQIINLRLKPGIYRLSCSLGDHAARGMQARLRVAPKPRRR